MFFRSAGERVTLGRGGFSERKKKTEVKSCVLVGVLGNGARALVSGVCVTERDAYTREGLNVQGVCIDERRRGSSRARPPSPKRAAREGSDPLAPLQPPARGCRFYFLKIEKKTEGHLCAFALYPHGLERKKSRGGGGGDAGEWWGLGRGCSSRASSPDDESALAEHLQEGDFTKSRRGHTLLLHLRHRRFVGR